MLGHEGMTLQEGALLPQTPLLWKRIFNSELPIRTSGSAGPSNLVEVGIDPSVSPWAAVQHGWHVSDQAVGVNMIRASGVAPTAGSD